MAIVYGIKLIGICRDCLVELEVEKRLGLKTKEDIERYGVERFIDTHHVIQALLDLVVEKISHLYIPLIRPRV